MAIQDETSLIVLPSVSKATSSLFDLHAELGRSESVHGTYERTVKIIPWWNNVAAAGRPFFVGKLSVCRVVYVVHAMQAWWARASFGGMVCEPRNLPRQWMRLPLPI
jgi:hypothetical protein